MPSVKYRRRSDYIYKIQAFDLKHNYTVYQVTIRIQMSKYTIDIPLKTNSMYFITSLELYKLKI